MFAYGTAPIRAPCSCFEEGKEEEANQRGLVCVAVKEADIKMCAAVADLQREA